jgi:hypothetical protein
MANRFGQKLCPSLRKQGEISSKPVLLLVFKLESCPRIKTLLTGIRVKVKAEVRSKQT